MTFGENLRFYRKKKGLTQAQLAALTGLGINTIINYEGGKTYPQNREVYSLLAEKLEVEVNMLKNEGDGIEDIKVETNTVTYDRMHAAKLVKEVNALFAGGNLSEADKDAVMFALQEAYISCKKENAVKYGRKTQVQSD